MIRLATLTLGYGFLALGVLGLFLPILQGVLFIVTGLLILSRHAPWARRLLDWLKARHPRVEQTIAAAERLADRAMQRAAEWWRATAARFRA